MGYLKDRFGIEMIGRAPAGTCPECGRDHELEMPHDNQSLVYQYRFYDEHGRWPTWNDAMAHCSEPVRSAWASELAKLGIDIDEESGTGVLSVEVDTSCD